MRHSGELSGVSEEHTRLRTGASSVKRAVYAEARVPEEEAAAAASELEELVGRCGEAVVAIVVREKRRREIEG